jgi:hypothetical protein
MAPNRLPNGLNDKTVNAACKELSVRDLKPCIKLRGSTSTTPKRGTLCRAKHED